MLENRKPSIDSPAGSANIATVKRYAPPSRRNRSLGRRKSGGVESTDRLEWESSYGYDGERNHMASVKSSSNVDQEDAGINRHSIECLRPRLIPLNGCSNSEAFQLLNNRWMTAMSAHSNLHGDSTERPVLYTKKSVPPWSQAIRPHLLFQPAVASGASTGLLRDFLGELRQAMNNADSGS